MILRYGKNDLYFASIGIKLKFKIKIQNFKKQNKIEIKKQKEENICLHRYSKVRCIR